MNHRIVDSPFHFRCSSILLCPPLAIPIFKGFFKVALFVHMPSGPSTLCNKPKPRTTPQNSGGGIKPHPVAYHAQMRSCIPSSKDQSGWQVRESQTIWRGSEDPLPGLRMWTLGVGRLCGTESFPACLIGVSTGLLSEFAVLRRWSRLKSGRSTSLWQRMWSMLKSNMPP